MINVQSLLAMFRAAASNPYGQLASALQVVGISLAVGAWSAAFGTASLAAVTLCIAAFNTPRLAHMRGSLFSL